MSRFELMLDREGASDTRFPIHGKLRPPPSADFDFVIIADRTGGAVYQMFEQGLQLAAALRPEFILSIGDLVEGYWTDEAEAEAEWDWIDGRLDGLGIPVLLTPGNHDYGTQTMINVWHRRKGADYYAVRYGPMLILVANSEAGANFEGEVPESVVRWNRYNINHPRQHTAISDLVNLGAAAVAEKYPDLFNPSGAYIDGAWKDVEEGTFVEAFNRRLMASEQFRDPRNLINPALCEAQLTFFERVLAEHQDVSWTLLSIHQPAWRVPNARFKRLQALLLNRSHTVVAGHTHLLDVEMKDGNLYATLGKTGGLHCFDGMGDIHHIVLVRVRNGKPELEIVRYEHGHERLPITCFISSTTSVGRDLSGD
jgi:hypothetical protein